MPGIVKFDRFLINPGLNLILLSGGNLGTQWPLNPFSRVFFLSLSSLAVCERSTWCVLIGSYRAPCKWNIEDLSIFFKSQMSKTF